MYHIVYILVIYALGCEWYIAGGQIGWGKWSTQIKICLSVVTKLITKTCI